MTMRGGYRGQRIHFSVCKEIFYDQNEEKIQRCRELLPRLFLQRKARGQTDIKGLLQRELLAMFFPHSGCETDYCRLR